MPVLHRHASPRTARLAALVVAALVGGTSPAADTATPRSPGLVPTPRKTREELVREWDLNSDGKIDQGEAEIAASRMRRERAELRLNSGIDPVTGLPRGEKLPPPSDATADDPLPEATPPADEEPPATTRPLPGTRVPRPAAPDAGHAKPESKPDSKPETPAPGQATRAAADLKRQPLTGGVRAGGLPARAGYGAGLPAAPLNAGLPVVRGRGAATQPAAPRGGLVPAPRSTAPRPAASRDVYDPY